MLFFSLKRTKKKKKKYTPPRAQSHIYNTYDVTSMKERRKKKKKETCINTVPYDLSKTRDTTVLRKLTDNTSVVARTVDAQRYATMSDVYDERRSHPVLLTRLSRLSRLSLEDERRAFKGHGDDDCTDAKT